MPLPCPHSLALFSLRPVSQNERAERVVSHPDNSHLVSTFCDGVLGLDVGFQIRGRSSNTLATLGRGVDTDIHVEGGSIAKVQCSFEIDLDTGVTMLYDRSFAKSTQVYGKNATPFEYPRSRKVVVGPRLNTELRMGGERRDLVQFELEWHQDPTELVEKIKNCEA